MEWISAKDLRDALIRGYGAGYANRVSGSVERNCRSGMLKANAAKYLEDGKEIATDFLPLEFWSGMVYADWSMGDFETTRLPPFSIEWLRKKQVPPNIRLQAFRVTFDRTDAEAMGAVFQDKPTDQAPSSDPPHDLLIPVIETQPSNSGDDPSMLGSEEAPVLKKWRGTQAMDLIDEIHEAARRLRDGRARSINMAASQEADAYVEQRPSADKENVKAAIDRRLREICNKDGSFKDGLDRAT